MNVLFISNGNYDYDGRMRELMKVAKTLGSTTAITCGNQRSIGSPDHYIFTIKGKFSYIAFILYSVKIARMLKTIDILFVDNRKALIPGFLIKSLKHPRYIIQDMRELYVMSETKHVPGKIGCFIEQSFLAIADIVIVANSYRAKFVFENYNLKQKPFTYENIRKLRFSTDVSMVALESQFFDKFSNKTVKVVSTSGCAVDRTNDILVKAMEKLGDSFELFLVGSGTAKDYQIINTIIRDKSLKNVHLLGQLNENELKFVIGKCDIGVVNYHMKDTNNLYCASGKIYEYLFEGLPVVTTENPPLKDICMKNQIGRADNTYVSAIQEIASNYESYKASVYNYIKTINDEENNTQLVNRIIKEMEK